MPRARSSAQNFIATNKNYIVAVIHTQMSESGFSWYDQFLSG